MWNLSNSASPTGNSAFPATKFSQSIDRTPSQKVVLHHLFDHCGTDRLALGLESQEQSLANDVSQLEISVDLSQIALHIGRVAHLPQVLPNDGSAIFDIKDEEVWICGSIPGKQDFALEQIIHAKIIQCVSNQDFRLRAHTFSAFRVNYPPPTHNR